MLRRRLIGAGLAVGLLFSTWSPGADAGTLTGTVSVAAEEKPSPPRRYYMGPYRSGQRQADSEQARSLDVVLYIEGVEGKPDSTLRVPAPVIVQTNEAFVPQVLPILAGTEVTFPNRDTYYHNVFSVMAGDRFDLGRYAEGETGSKVFEIPGVVVVRCEIHPRMKAYIRVLKTPFFTVPDSTGRYAFPGLQPGQYTVKAWHPTRGEQERTVALGASGELVVDFSF